MNRLLSFLRSKNDLTVKRLKQVYRELCKRTHPDMSSGNHDEFIRLRQEYEECLALLENGKPANEPKTSAPEEVRENFLESLYLFSIRLFGSGGEKTLADLIEAAGPYRKDVQSLWTEYRDLFYHSRKSWAGSGDIFYAHNLLIASIKQLFYYYSYSAERHKTLLLTYFQDLEKRSGKLDADQARILKGLAIWLQEESELEKIGFF